METQVLHTASEFQWLTARRWRLLPCHPRSKAPLGALVPHGVKDATDDLEVIAAWLERVPDANWAVATGAPGPQVLDIDNQAAVPTSVFEAVRRAPRAVTARGWHVYFAGTDRATVSLPCGELRGAGSYVLIPPSIHPSGHVYEWRVAPRGPLAPAPVALTRGGSGKRGTGDHVAPLERIPHGHRHEYLCGFAVHMLRGGFTDVGLIEDHLRSEFERICEPLPAPGRGDFRAMAWWAVRTDIAERERRRNGR